MHVYDTVDRYPVWNHVIRLACTLLWEDMSCRSRGSRHSGEQSSQRRSECHSYVLDSATVELSWQKEARPLSSSRSKKRDHRQTAVISDTRSSAKHATGPPRRRVRSGMPARAQLRTRLPYVQGRWRSATAIGKIRVARTRVTTTEMAGYNHSNPQRVVYHATYPTPLAPSEFICYLCTRQRTTMRWTLVIVSWIYYWELCGIYFKYRIGRI